MIASRPLLQAALLLAALAFCTHPLAAGRPLPADRAASVPPGVKVPSWSELSPGQQHDLARFQDRWDDMPASRRVAILERWQRWQAAPPETREQMRRGARNFRAMSPELRERMRRSLAAVAALPPEEQRRLRGLWQQLSPEGRREWLERGGPGIAPPPGAGPRRQP